MRLYVGIDLHSNNNQLAIIDVDRRIYHKRQPNMQEVILAELMPFRESPVGILVESTFNWYWLVDLLMENNFKTHWGKTAAITGSERSGLFSRAGSQFDAGWRNRFPS